MSPACSCGPAATCTSIPTISSRLGCSLTREPRSLPQLILKDRGQTIFDYEPEDFAFEAYEPHPHISAPVAV